ncbi:MAG: twin-arginine translocase TatA/TatE family subunit [Chloroflexota bacterium]
MNFLGMGPMELVLIMVLALIVFGPGKLPEIAGQVGRMVRDFRSATSDMSSEFNKAFSLETEQKAQQDQQASTSAPTYPSLPAGPVSSIASTDATSRSPSESEEHRIAPPSAAGSGRTTDLQPPY